MTQILKHTQVFDRLLPLAGRLVVEVGAGDGALARRFAREGAGGVIAVEPSRAMLAAGRAASAKAAAERGQTAAPAYVGGVAEALPFADAVADAVVFLNAFHHVPTAAMGPAVAEAARVLRPGGRLLVVEPLAAGAYFELVRAVEDETAVRAAAYACLVEAGRGPGFRLAQEIEYDAPVRHRDFDAWRRRFIAVDPDREAQIAAVEPALRAGFERVSEPDGDARRILQPSRATLLERCA